ncbi:MAG: cell division ATP-binding protein FtsE [Candidatus Levyibacteriota bacterium]
MIRLINVSKVFGTGVAGLADVSLGVDKGEFVFLVGKTGSGKTTLLRLLIREMLPTDGTIFVGEYDIVKLPQNKIPHLRKKIGVIFQDLKLLMDRTIGENVSLPLELSGMTTEDIQKKVEELLTQVDMIEHKEKFPVQLSGGELQRIAIARALALSPDILLADEPTGNLDNKTAFEIVDLLSSINEQGTTILMATHNMDIVEKLNKRVVSLEKGKVIRDEKKAEKHHHEKGKDEKKEEKEEKKK